MGKGLTNQAKPRNPSIELWRCFCMFAVVWWHVILDNKMADMSWFAWHIPGFLVLSGYFGIKFSWRKIGRLLSICYVCYWMTIPFRGIGDWRLLLLPHGGWYVPFYIVLMLISPILNSALKDKEKHGLFVTGLSIVLVASWLPSFIPRLGMMRVSGTQGNGLLLMISIYVFARLVSIYEIERKMKAWAWWGAFVVAMTLSAMIFHRYPESCRHVAPLAIVTALVGFCAFARLKLPHVVNQVICFVSPSMFGVYIIHECCLRNYGYSDFAAHSFWHSFLWAAGFFGASLGIDLVRRAGALCLLMLAERLHGKVKLRG